MPDLTQAICSISDIVERDLEKRKQTRQYRQRHEFPTPSAKRYSIERLVKARLDIKNNELLFKGLDRYEQVFWPVNETTIPKISNFIIHRIVN